MTIQDYLDPAQGVLKASLGQNVVQELVKSIPEEHLLSLSVQQVIRILPALAHLSDDDPYALLVVPHNSSDSSQGIELTVLTFDQPGLFATLSGILSALGFATYEGTMITTQVLSNSKRRAAVDIFWGKLPTDGDLELWEGELRQRLQRVFALYPQGPEKVKQFVIEEVARALRTANLSAGEILAPMTISYTLTPTGRARFEIASTNTPFFLYSLSSALSLHHVSIEALEIRTRGDQILDVVELAREGGSPLDDEHLLNRIKLSILMSKQFTYFVDRAPDPLRALVRFDALVQDIGEVRSSADIQQLLASADLQKELALILGTSDFLWEDFIRVQHENILPMIRSLGEQELLSTNPQELEISLHKALETARNQALSVATRVSFQDPVEQLQGVLAAQVKALNDFKNRESFLIDLDHILVKELDFFFLSRRLTALAEAVVKKAVELAWAELTPRHGIPRTAAGIQAEWAIFGLGKLGGRALGYASDIELLFVYSDSGTTDGQNRLANRDFFERLFKNGAGKITARREGIFKVDLRLRPHGDDGPVAVRLQSFIDYFGRDGQAHSAERLALVRLRWIGGSKDLGDQVSRIRDRVIYEEDSIDISELRTLRRRQFEEKTGTKKGTKPRTNAKFSPGTLVDLEYNVQILQVIHGRHNPQLRVPGIHQALEELSALGTIDPDEAEAMVRAYQFFRILINGLRMLRGNAEDLFLPDRKDIEFRHLARRIGYEPTQNQQEEDQLSIDFETFSAKIRQFVERHLGRDALPTPAAGSVVDLILNQAVSDELLARVMDQGGFLNHRRALVNIKSLAGSAEQQQEFSRLIVLSWDTLVTSPDPDMALNNWEQFVRRLPDPLEHFRQLLSQPKRISLLLSLFGVSQFLSDTLIQNPDFFAWITDPSIVGKARDQITMEQDLRVQAQESHSRLDWVNRLRLFRKREILRIGLRDLGLGVKLEEIMGEISFLARACCEVALDQCWKRVAPSGTDPSLVGPDPDHLVVCGFGKLGGWELNYSSDIDLVAIYQPRGESRTEEEELTYTKVVKSLVQDLTDFTQEGQAYRVDLRLRPYGVSGPLVSTLTSILDYYENHADLWEFQALIKLKPVAGNLSLGEIFLDRVRDPFIQKWDPPRVRSSIARMRDLALKEHTSRLGDRIDVKNSKGGIRDIEFRVQGLQLIHSAEYPQLLKGNTLRSLALLREQGIISESDLHQVSGDYRFLRRIEHYLQISEDRQLHTLPDSLQQREKLAWFLSDALAEVGKKPQGTARFRAEEFFATLQQVMIRVRTAYEEFLNPRS